MTDGLEFATADVFDNKKLNQKCTTIGNGTQLNALINPHAGQQIYPTDSSNGWLIDRPDSRDSADTKWHYPQLRVGSVTTIGENPGVESVLAGPSIQNSSKYFLFTLPTTEKFYKITNVEGIGGNTNASATHTTQAGVDIFDTNTGNSISVALSPKVSSQGGVGFNHGFNHRMYIPGGSVCAIWIAATGANSFTFGRRTSGTNPTTWAVWESTTTTPYTQNTGSTFTSNHNNLLFVVTYQGYY